MSSTPRDVLGPRIAAERARKGWTQAELTQRVTGKPRSATSSDWEAGKKIPDAVTLAAIADALGVTADYLLGRENASEGESDGSVSLATIIALYESESQAAGKRAEGMLEWAVAVRIAEEEGRARREGAERAAAEAKREAERITPRPAPTPEEILRKKKEEGLD